MYFKYAMKVIFLNAWAILNVLYKTSKINLIQAQCVSLSLNMSNLLQH